MPICISPEYDAWERHDDYEPYQVPEEDEFHIGWMYIDPAYEEVLLSEYPYCNYELSDVPLPDHEGKQYVSKITSNGQKPPPPPFVPAEPSDTEKIQALTEQLDFYEECIVEMANVVYA